MAADDVWAKAYPAAELAKSLAFTDIVGTVSLKIEYAPSSTAKNPQTGSQVPGTVRITRNDSGAVVPHEVGFWFAWVAFHPHTELYQAL